MTTTAALLVTVAVSALAGCVTLQHPATSAPPPYPTPALPAVPRPDGSAEPRVVQAPAREALEMTGPSRHPKHPAPPSPRRPAEAPPVTHRPPVAPAAPPHPRPHPEIPPQPHTNAPVLPNPAPKAPGVCALGRQYGGWREDSPESQICDRTYGH
ncbi:hypothetical protein [Streptomyces roseochromogenus]|uniref:Lipoprotein n=1 Tax=Streptomyces roseochromogenus subsp. oscitans DS 12.976 TaxID=1352936 RepID=V6JMR2_STRRC|nr:hypothetical protein [Streptomyces roseochromogenus]EST21013.1 hypothetical protein M878_38190 [Streptomyces roseochromogenus subsp. oscitans DS 12.976]